MRREGPRLVAIFHVKLRRPSAQLVLEATAAFALLWVIARACLQSITIDEADTYLCWVAKPDPSHWSPASNNHLLNSLLMRLFISLFGLSHLTARAPALIGAAVYIAMAYLLCRRVAGESRLAWPLLVCLVYNPMVMDHLVAARGYSLALAFLMVALSTIASGRFDVRACAICSACAALSMAGNLSFALVNAVMMGAVLVIACVRTPALRDRLRLFGACTLPGLAVSLFLTAHEVLHFPRDELRYGARSLRAMFLSVRESSLFRLNPQIVHPTLFGLIEVLTPYLLPALLALAAWQFRRRQPAFAYLLVGVLAAAICGHWVLFRLFHVLLPLDRTAIWLVPLVTLTIGAVAVNRRALTVMVYAMSIYFVLCLRLHYFKEWEWDADVQDVYPVLAWYNHMYGVRDIASNWQYGAALNFYRLQSGRETLEEIPSPVDKQGGHAIYVLNYEFDQDFAKQQRLHAVYHGRTTDIVVAVREGVESAHNSFRAADPVN